ncbi:hypothetical protein Scep_007692 [Stephania cephalantha]|uniref:Uncharacterized protein n=1 Tax=Stephania cephalantha TaxID=152367 RepID=A0AAP0KD04_9MAGN
MEEMGCFSYFYSGEDEEFNHGKARDGGAKEAQPTVICDMFLVDLRIGICGNFGLINQRRGGGHMTVKMTAAAAMTGGCGGEREERSPW